ncbi:MAG: four helix bundle protein [Gemmatimonadaceae bacterium]
MESEPAEFREGEPGPVHAGDPIRRMAAYRLALEVLDFAWADAATVRTHPTTAFIASQLYRSASSIGANICDGYSRSSGKDRVRFFEYALSSARECRFWYHAARHVLERADYEKRTSLLTRICQILLKAIPKERDRDIRPDPNGGEEQ